MITRLQPKLTVDGGEGGDCVGGRVHVQAAVGAARVGKCRRRCRPFSTKGPQCQLRHHHEGFDEELIGKYYDGQFPGTKGGAHCRKNVVFYSTSKKYFFKISQKNTNFFKISKNFQNNVKCFKALPWVGWDVPCGGGGFDSRVPFVECMDRCG
jgi:hypothetical protein